MSEGGRPLLPPTSHSSSSLWRSRAPPLATDDSPPLSCAVPRSCGRKRHLWISVSADLCVDAARDLTDIGAKSVRIVNITKLGYGSKLEQQKVDGKKFDAGVLFATYSALLGRSGKKSRLELIVEWLGGGTADGCILFDEAHKAKNLHVEADEKAEQAQADLAAGRPVKGGGRGGRAPKAKSTKMAKAVEELQTMYATERCTLCPPRPLRKPPVPTLSARAPVERFTCRCPSGRVVYCSATGASSLANMAYMSRLGLWGKETAFPEGFVKFEKARVLPRPLLPSPSTGLLSPRPRSASPPHPPFASLVRLSPRAAPAPWSSLPST